MMYLPPLWRRCRFSVLGLVLVIMFGLLPLAAAEPERITQANYKQAFHYSPEFLRQFTYSVSVNPNWIGKTDSFWYTYRTSKGTSWWRVDPKQATKLPLFDHVKMAMQLSELVQKPLDAAQLPLTRASMNEEGNKLKFVVDDTQYEFDFQAEKIAKLGKAPPVPAGFGGPGGGNGFRRRIANRVSAAWSFRHVPKSGASVRASRGIYRVNRFAQRSP